MPRHPPSVGTRKRPRAWDKLAAITRTERPLCVLCLAAGRTTPAVCTDHIVPIAEGGDALDPRNLQPLCRDCHEAKTADENARPDARPRLHDTRIRVLCGPPCSDAPAIAWHNAKPGDFVFDFDALASTLAHADLGASHRRDCLPAIVKVRDALLDAARDGLIPGTLTIVVTDLDSADAMAARTGAKVGLVPTCVDDCLERLERLRLPRDTQRRLASLVTAWHASYEARRGRGAEICALPEPGPCGSPLRARPRDARQMLR